MKWHIVKGFLCSVQRVTMLSYSKSCGWGRTTKLSDLICLLATGCQVREREVRDGVWLFFISRGWRPGAFRHLWWQSCSVLLLRPRPHHSPSSQVGLSCKATLSIYTLLDFIGHRFTKYQDSFFIITETSPSPPSPCTAVSGIMTGSSGHGRVSGVWGWSRLSTLLWTFSSALSVLRTPTLTTDRSRPQSLERLSEILMQILY